MLLIPLRSAIKQCFLDILQNTPHQCSLWFPQFDQQRRGIWPPKEMRKKCTNLNTVNFSSIWKQAHHTTILGSVWSRKFVSVCSLGWAVSKRWSREKDCEFTRMCVMWSGSDGMKQAWHGRETSARIVRVEVWDSIGSKESRCGWMTTWIQSTTVWKLWREHVRDNIHLQAIKPPPEIFGNNKWFCFAFLAKIPICYHTFVLTTIRIIHCVWNFNYGKQSWSKFNHITPYSFVVAKFHSYQLL